LPFELFETLIMKNRRYLAVLIPIALILNACDTTSSSKPDPSAFLVSENFNRTITQQQISDFWSLIGAPEAADYAQYDVDVYRVVYNTRGVDGNPIEASGAILVPSGIENPGLLSIQHATIFNNDEAPSVDRNNILQGIVSVTTRKAVFASAGYVSFLPDYLGYGITGDQLHPYQQAETLASASYDMLFAGLEFLDQRDIQFAGENVSLMGYSEGAYATLALAEKIESRNNGLDLGLVSMGAPIFDLTATMDYIIENLEEPMECVACYAYFLYTYHQLYNFTRPLSDYFQSPYAGRIADGLFSGENSSGFVQSQMPDEAVDLFNPSFIVRYLDGGESELRAAVAENDLFYVPIADVLLVHGDEDGVAPVFNSDDFESRALAAGKANFTYLRPEGVTHGTGIFPWGVETLEALGVRSKRVAVN